MTWKASLPCTQAEAEHLDADALADVTPPPTLVATEEAEGRWRLDAYFEARPDRPTLGRLAGLAPSAGRRMPVAEQLADEDWVTLSQAGLEPVRAGRFFVHTPQHRDKVPRGTVALEIDAGLAFGTGQHETTTGCLQALDRLKWQGFVARNLIDVGTGTGLLAFAAMRLWPQARAAAADIDPVSIKVTRENAAVNRVPLGIGPGRLATAVAPGLEHRELLARAPYDLIVANILAAPLIDLAPSLAAALMPGGRIVLAGLLTKQAAAVTRAYRREGLRPLFREVRGDWPTLVLRRPLA